jgi:hypothetical protein
MSRIGPLSNVSQPKGNPSWLRRGKDKRRDQRQIDWAAIRVEWEAGASERSIAARYGVSHTGIAKRSRKDAWSIDARNHSKRELAERLVGAVLADEVALPGDGHLPAIQRPLVAPSRGDPPPLRRHPEGNQQDGEADSGSIDGNEDGNRLASETAGMTPTEWVRSLGMFPELGDVLRTVSREEILQARLRVIARHRGLAHVGMGVVELLMGQLALLSNHIEDFEEFAGRLCEDDKDPARFNAFMRAISLQERSATIRNLAQTSRQLVAIERQAVGLPIGDAEDDQDAQRAKRPVFRAYYQGRTSPAPIKG